MSVEGQASVSTGGGAIGASSAGVQSIWHNFPLDRLRATYFDHPSKLSWRCDELHPPELLARIEADVAGQPDTILVRSPSDGVYFHQCEEALDNFVRTDWTGRGLEQTIDQVVREGLICPRDWYRQQCPYALLQLLPALTNTRMVILSADLFYEHAPSAAAVLLWGLGLLTVCEPVRLAGEECNHWAFRFSNADDSLVYWNLCNNKLLEISSFEQIPQHRSYSIGAPVATTPQALHMHDLFSEQARQAAVSAFERGDDPLRAAFDTDVLPMFVQPAHEPLPCTVRVDDVRQQPVLEGLFYSLEEVFQATASCFDRAFVLYSTSHWLAGYPAANSRSTPFLHSADDYLTAAQIQLDCFITKGTGGEPNDPILFTLAIGEGWGGPAVNTLEPPLGCLKSLAGGAEHVDKAFEFMWKMMD